MRRLLVPLLVVSLAAVGMADDFDMKQLQQEVISTIDDVRPAVASISSGGSFFSGVVVSPDGHVLSAGHAVRPGGRYRVRLPDGRTFSGVGKGSNPNADCALIRLTEEVDDLPFVEMGDSSALKINQPCLSLSFPGGQGTKGVPVARFGRIVRSSPSRGLLQSTALMEPGDSGGALFDLDGRVIGIHSRIGRSMDRNYEVPIDIYKKYWNELNWDRSFTDSGPPTPRLGFRGFERRNGDGVAVTDVIPDTLAAKNGLQADDIITMIFGKTTNSIAQVRRALIAARDEGVEQIVVNLLRNEEEVELEIDFDIDREQAPEAELPKYAKRELTTPSGMRELRDLPAQFADLEDELDNNCIEISSEYGEGEVQSIFGTLIRDSKFVISKSSVVGDNPMTDIAGNLIDLEVIARDTRNDLVLLTLPSKNKDGVELEHASATPAIGRFLLTPDAEGDGLISILSTKNFESRKQQSRGYLGVMPATFQRNGGAVLNEVTEDGAADRAGLEVGDIVVQLNDTPIRTHMDMRQFLSTVDPNETITAKVQRDEDELEKQVTLGTFPSFSGHAADMMDKSGRRDGFSEVIPHDADLEPQQCGGPVFDLEGNFMGLNIARNSRVRSYAIPARIVRDFLQRETSRQD